MRRLGCHFALRRYGWAALLVNAAVLCAPAAAGEAVRIATLGDSLTAGYGLPMEETFTAQLETALRAAGAEVVIANAGVSGDTTAGGRARLDWVLADKPDLVIVELGANDGLRGLDPAMTYQNLDDILTRLAAAGVRVLLAGMVAPPNLGREYGEGFRRDLSPPRREARRRPLSLFSGGRGDRPRPQPARWHPPQRGRR